MYRHLLLAALLAPSMALGFFAMPQEKGAPKDTAVKDRSPVTFKKNILPFLTKHCYACHGNGKKKAGLALDKYQDEDALFKDRQTWDNVVHQIQTGEMPPKERPRPKLEETAALVKAIDTVLHSFDRNAKPNVGRVTIRR